MKNIIKPLSTAFAGAVLALSAVGVVLAEEPRLWMCCLLGVFVALMYLYSICEEAAK